MIEISHEIIRYSVHIKDIFCCDCFYDEIYFLLRRKVNCETLEARFLYVENCYFDFIYGTAAMVICHDLLVYMNQKYSLIGKNCITNLVNTKPIKTELCSICVVDVFRKADVLHIFKLKW